MNAYLTLQDIQVFLMERAKLIDEMRAHKRRVNQMNHFRLLNENEIRCMHKHTTSQSPFVVEMVFTLEVAYSRSQGGFTVCNVKCTLANGDVILLSGASRRSYKDKPNTTRGEILAFRRAIQTKPILLSSSSEVEGVTF